MCFLLSRFLVLSLSFSNNQKKNFCFPLTQDFHIHLKLDIQHLVQWSVYMSFWRNTHHSPKYSSVYHIHLDWFVLAKERTVIPTFDQMLQRIIVARTALECPCFGKPWEKYLCSKQMRRVVKIFIVIHLDSKYPSISRVCFLHCHYKMSSWKNYQQVILHPSTRMALLISCDEVGWVFCRTSW